MNMPFNRFKSTFPYPFSPRTHTKLKPKTVISTNTILTRRLPTCEGSFQTIRIESSTRLLLRLEHSRQGLKDFIGTFRLDPLKRSQSELANKLGRL